VGQGKKLIIERFPKSAVKCHPIARELTMKIHVMSANGTGVRQSSQSRGRNTSSKCSPDGKRISCDHASQGECDIFVIDAPAS